MSQPTPYERLYSFTDYQTVNPANPLPATELDAELNAIALTAGQIRANLGLIQRDDGALANQTVTPDSLSAGALAMIHQGEYLPRGAWIAARAFALGDVVTYNAATYLCIVAHTSVTQFATDLAAGKWLLIANGALAGGGQAVDLFEGNGSTATFALSFTYNGNNAAVVFVGGVAQIPGQDFTISGSSITFVSAPPAPAVAGRKNVMVRGTGIEAQLAADGAATAAANASASATAAANSATAANASQSAAATSAANAATSATSAAGSATTATTKASEATTSASAAAASQTAAAASQTAAATSATNAANSATAAAGSATTATNQATTATNQATAAANSATAASNSATAAAGSASTASGAATTATNQASAASTSATAASTSASNAANSASQAATSASNAAASASSASSSASSANTSAVNAATSATNASNSATAAGTSAAAASTSATNAANSATTATTQATNASNSATAAAGSASAAAASAASAAAALDSFDDRYLGPKSADPTVDNDGNALVTGALYYRTTAPIGMKVWDGAQWLEASAAQQASLVTFEYVATAGQTTFSGADANGVTLSYTVGNALVSVNGVRLRPGDDFTATNGTSVVLVAAAAAGDEVLIDAFRTFEVANTYTQAQADAKYVGRDSSTGAAFLPVGTTAQRPENPNGSMIRKNTTTGLVEYYDPSLARWIGIGAFQASGGTITDIGSDRVHTFTSSGTFTVSAGVKAVQVLVVAGGGGGGDRFGAGGGAGGVIYSASVTATPGSYAINIGAGGAGGQTNNSTGIAGSNTTAFGLTAIGGGFGTSENGGNGGSGGSGGGGSWSSTTPGSGTSGQGNSGGAGIASPRVSGGGGGASQAGAGGANVQPNGGNGTAYSISGSSTYYGGGGGGADNRVDSAGFGGPAAGNGGLGGGGAGGGGEGNGQASSASGVGGNGTANTGGGGGGGAYIPSSATGRPGGNGGSGIVIIRYTA